MGEISFDEFFKLMQHLRQTEGFTKAEIDQFTGLFNKFDVDGSGEISTLELSQILRNLGYPTSVDVLQGLIAEVDVDGSGEIDIGELLKLLRKYRNREMMQSQYASTRRPKTMRTAIDLHRNIFQTFFSNSVGIPPKRCLRRLYPLLLGNPWIGTRS